MNNFEKIKQMSVDEMAEFFAEDFREKYICYECEFHKKDNCTKQECTNHFKNYLLQEVEKWT